MDSDLKELFDKLIRTIESSKGWIGQTNREVRDEVAGGAAEITVLKNQMMESTHSLVLNIQNLTAAINAHSTSNNKVSRWMVALTIILTISTFAMAIATVMMAIIAFNGS